MFLKKWTGNLPTTKIGEYIFAFLFIVLLWQLLSWALDISALPGPFIALKVFLQDFYPFIAPHFLMSIYRVILSLVIALLMAVPLGLFLGGEKKWDRLFSPVIYLIYPVPKVAFLPVIFVLAGIGNLSKILLITIIIFFHILVTTRDAARGISPRSIYSVLSLGANRRDVYYHVIFPYCLPKILTATRISLGTAIAVLFLSETVAGSTGLGYFILDSWYRAEYAQMFAGIISMGLMGLLLYKGMDLLEKRWCHWQHY